MERKDDEDWVKRTTRLEIEGSRPAGRPKKTCNETVKADLRQLRLDSSEASNTEAWRRAIYAAGFNPGAPGKRTRKR